MPRMKKLSFRKYWSTDEVLKTNIFRKIMARVSENFNLTCSSGYQLSAYNKDCIVLKKKKQKSVTPIHRVRKKATAS